jgi:eukaryotic-like serine/threonine-protein kinase
MSLSSGSRLGSYEILAPLGAGGMGEVYRARDTRLRREIAIKVLPDTFASDAQRLGRFEREAQLLASLSHPNIAAIHGFDEADGTHFLVLELVVGETLAERLAEGPLELEESLNIGRQIAEGVEAAHERGVIHRDLKPSNVKITPEGKVKVLDFGLAKALGGEPSTPDLSQSPTVAPAATSAGIILGTAAYMSPEQARGKPLDKRTDIWSFGCVLYETLTGRQAFSGESVSDNLVAILGREPDWQALPATTPAKIRDLLRRCLQKDSTRRLRDIGDARLEIEEALAGGIGAETAPRGVESASRPAGSRAIPWSIAAIALLVAAVATWRAPRGGAHEPAPLQRLTISLPPGAPVVTRSTDTMALSPDGQDLVYVGPRGGIEQLYRRPLDRLEAGPMPGTENAFTPFFSPDGEWVGFFADGKLKKIALTGGMALSICEAPRSRGASWGPDNTIVFAPTSDARLWSVSASGGAPKALTTLDSREGDKTHSWPEILPTGKVVVFTVGTDSGKNRIAALRLATGERRILVEGGSRPQYVATDHLLYAGAEGVLAAPFDPKALVLTGSPRAILEPVPQFAVSRDGLLVYIPTSSHAGDRALVWVDRKGNAGSLTDARRAYLGPRLSPDGKQLAVGIGAGPTKSDIWVCDIQRGALTRLTFDEASSWPIWTRDGKRIAFSSSRAGEQNLFWKPADGSGPEERLTTSSNRQFAHAFSSADQTLAFDDAYPGDIWILPIADRNAVRPLLQSPFREYGPRFSPDGHWLAYLSDESARFELYVRPYPGPGGRWQISTEGANEPVWSRNGREVSIAPETE